MSATIEPFATLLAGLVGLVFGSFANVCIARLPEGMSVVRPRSRCPRCGTPIVWYRNIPIVSWVVLRGRCASCRERISWRYPFVEALCGTLFAGLWILYGPSGKLLIAAPFALMLVVLFFTDWDHQLLPDAITLVGFGVGLAAAWINPFLGEPGWGRIWAAMSGAALGSGFLWVIGFVYERLRGVEAMGLGDVKMMAMVGAFTGPQGVAFTLFVASVVGAAVGVALIPLRGRTMRDMLPFGCFLAPAALAALIVGRRLVGAYLTLVGLDL